MNIQEAKNQIKNSIIAYFTKDNRGNYIIPPEKQRPLFLMGPPGIGKTAIMEQVAAEMGVGLLSYSMTHHTRQSLLGLPFIEHKTYGGVEYDISEYTMSEVIASVYDMMEETGVREGILFLDEINCVSETLAPVMLQFLQYKIFGKHRIPEGWIVVTAGNPPEYNDSVRDFDIVTWDRLKRVDIDPDYDAWKPYAYQRSIHPAIMTYLEIKKADFYLVESTVDGKAFVTARGWDDLSQMITLYEMNGITVDDMLISQYIRSRKIVTEFGAYYDLFLKYRSDYQVDMIMQGREGEEIRGRARAAAFDEKLSLIGLLIDAAGNETRRIMERTSMLEELKELLLRFKETLSEEDLLPADILKNLRTEEEREIESAGKSGSASREAITRMQDICDILNSFISAVADERDHRRAFETVSGEYAGLGKALVEDVKLCKEHFSNMFTFCEAVFDEGQEMLIVVTELTASHYTSAFISRYGCDEYYSHNKELMFFERGMEIKEAIKKLEL